MQTILQLLMYRTWQFINNPALAGTDQGIPSFIAGENWRIQKRMPICLTTNQPSHVQEVNPNSFEEILVN